MDVNASRHDSRALLRLLGLSQQDFKHVRAEPTAADAQRALDDLKRKAKQAYRKLVFERHPDRGGDEAWYKQVMPQVEALLQQIQQLRLVSRPRAPTAFSAWPDLATTSATNTSTVTMDGAGFMNIRIVVRRG